MENFIERHKRRFEPGGIYEKGYGYVSKQVMQDRSLSIGARTLYAYLCSYMGNGDSCYPTRSKICYDLGISRNTFPNYCAELVEAGYLKVEKARENENGRFLYNMYFLNDSAISKESSPCHAEPDHVQPDHVQPDHAEEDTNNNNIKNNSIKNNNLKSNAPATEEEKEDKKKKGSRRFVKPALEEIKNYCTERCSTVDPEAFYDFYEMNGWVQGKDKPIRDWQAAVRNWERRDREAGKKPPRRKNKENEVELPF